jgi:hypothetical protein
MITATSIIKNTGLMRKILGLIGLLAMASLSAQDFERVEVVKVDSTRSAADLYRTAERWFVDTFKDAEEVIQLRDTISHTLVGKGMGQVAWVYSGAPNIPLPWRYSVEVQTKDGRYRVKVYDMATLRGGTYYSIMDTPCCLDMANCNYVPKTKAEQKYDAKTKAANISVCEQIRSEVAALIASLNLAMTKPKDDW